MAHVVGVPRRDPCHKCKLPVFLAERLTVGKKIYHRRCLKCARCGSQLTPGSFYETEIDDQYCCETCPDEEIIGATAENMDESGDNVVLRKSETHATVKDSIGGPTTEVGAAKPPVRSSIAARLAFFEQNKENSLNANQDPTKDPFLRRLSLKNASDEDKSKNLHEGDVKYPSAFAPYKPNSAMSSFLYDAVDGDGGGSPETTEPTENHSPSKKLLASKQDSISDNENEDLNMIVNEKSMRKKVEVAAFRLEGSPTFTTSVSLGTPQLVGSPTFTKSFNTDGTELESSQTITKILNINSPLLADKLTSNKNLDMDSLPSIGSPTFNKSLNTELPRAVDSLNFNESLNKESPREVESPTFNESLNMGSPRSVGSPSFNKPSNLKESPRAVGSLNFNENLNKQSPRTVKSPTFNKNLNMGSPRTVGSPTFNKSINVEEVPRSVGSPTLNKESRRSLGSLTLNNESRRSLESPTLESPRSLRSPTFNMDSPRSLGSPTFNKKLNNDSPRSVGSPALNNEKPRSLGSPTLNKSLNMGSSRSVGSPILINDSPRSIGSPTFDRPLHLTAPRLGASPLSSSLNERSISPSKPARLLASPTFTARTELDLHPSPRLGTSPTFSKPDNNTSIYDTPLFIDEDNDLDKDKDKGQAKSQNKNVHAVKSDESQNIDKVDADDNDDGDDDVLLTMKETLEQNESNLDLKKEDDVKENHHSVEPLESSEHLIAIKAQELEKAMNKLTNESLMDESREEVELRDKSRRFSKEYDEDKQTIERLSVVRARLQQFEAVAKANDNENENLRSSPPNDSKLTNNITNDNIDSPNEVPVAKESNDILETTPVVSLSQNEVLPVLEEPMEDQPILDGSETVSETPKDTSSEMVTKTTNESPEETKASNESTLEMESENEIKTQQQPLVEDKIVEQPIAPKTDEETPEPEGIPKIQSSIVMPAASSSTLKANDPRTSSKISIENYPKELDPFKSDTDEDDKQQPGTFNTSTPRRSTKSTDKALNPFDSSDDEVELEKLSQLASPTSLKVPPPRPPPPRLTRNPFSEDTDEENNFTRRSSVSSSLTKKTPIPTPRRNLSKSQNPTPEPTPRLSSKITQNSNGSEYFGSDNSISSALTTPTSSSLLRNSEVRSSNNSLCSSFGGTMRSRKTRRAPLPPSMTTTGPAPVKELFPSSETLNSSRASTPSSSTRTSPKLHRKKRPAPAPPKPARLDPNLLPQITLNNINNNTKNSDNGNNTSIEVGESKNLNSYPLQSQLDSIYYDENKTLLEGKPLKVKGHQQHQNHEPHQHHHHRESGGEVIMKRQGSMRMIPLDASILDDPVDHLSKSDDFKHKLQQQEESQAVYRRILIPPKLDITPTHDYNPIYVTLDNERQIEKLKDNKEAQNRNRQSHNSTISSNDTDENFDSSIYYDKASQGKWKRRKGPAPALPIPPRKVLQMLPLQEIKHELEIIEVQQQGLEKQGVILEKMIRDRCEGANGEQLGVRNSLDDIGNKIDVSGTVQNSKEVEDLILQLFELVNEKNELFRRQAELMYLRRQHRLEQEQADLEYEIRVLMAQPERNKTDSDKSREESLIARFIEVVRLRNEVIECLEMDRLREAEEDLSIKQRLEIHTANRRANDSPTQSAKTEKLSKKEKKKQKETKKLSKDKKIDVDKDADESELNCDKDKEKNLKKKKMKFLFLSK